MISPELLRRYPFFGCLDDAQTKALAMITEEVAWEAGTTVFDEGGYANSLYFLMEGAVDLYYQAGANRTEQLVVGQINPGEPFAISAVIEPYQLTSTARAAEQSRGLRLDAAALRALFEVDCRLGYYLMRQIATAAIERLNFTRVELAAERALDSSPLVGVR